jgi:hypothetical protein
MTSPVSSEEHQSRRRAHQQLGREAAAKRPEVAPPHQAVAGLLIVPLTTAPRVPATPTRTTSSTAMRSPSAPEG